MHIKTRFAERSLGPGLQIKHLFVFLAVLFLSTGVTSLHAQRQAGSAAAATLNGSITDATGALLPGAAVVLEDISSHKKLTDITDGEGDFIFTPVPPGNYSITVTCDHFIPNVQTDIVLHAGDYRDLKSIALQPVTTDAQIIVHANQNFELAQQQLQVELHQRVLGVIPNFYVTYDPNPAPLSTGMKYKLALKATFDVTTIVSRGMIAGIEQADDTFPGYGQGMQGYGKRYGSAVANDFFGNMLAYAVFPSILHQDPRYIYQGTGSIKSRLGHALISPVQCRGDNGKYQVNYSNILGTFAASGISNFYYAKSDRQGYQLTLDNSAIGFVADAASSIFQEFFLKKLMNLSHKNKKTDE